MTAKVKFLTVAVVLIFGTWVVLQLRNKNAASAAPVAAKAKPVAERFIPGVHY